MEEEEEEEVERGSVLFLLISLTVLWWVKGVCRWPSRKRGHGRGTQRDRHKER